MQIIFKLCFYFIGSIPADVGEASEVEHFERWDRTILSKVYLLIPDKTFRTRTHTRREHILA